MIYNHVRTFINQYECPYNEEESLMRKLVRMSVRSDNITLDRKAIGNPVISQDLNKIIEKYAALSVQPYLHSLNYAYFYFYEDTEEYNQFRTDAEKLNMMMGE